MYCELSLYLMYPSFQRQIRIENLELKSRAELIEIYNKLVVPLPQRTQRKAQQKETVHENVLKRKVGGSGDSGGSAEKIVRNGINDLTIQQQQLKRSPNSIDDDPMDGSSGTKRKPITWP